MTLSASARQLSNEAFGLQQNPLCNSVFLFSLQLLPRAQLYNFFVRERLCWAISSVRCPLRSKTPLEPCVFDVCICNSNAEPLRSSQGPDAALFAGELSRWALIKRYERDCNRGQTGRASSVFWTTTASLSLRSTDPTRYWGDTAGHGTSLTGFSKLQLVQPGFCWPSTFQKRRPTFSHFVLEQSSHSALAVRCVMLCRDAVSWTCVVFETFQRPTAWWCQQHWRGWCLPRSWSKGGLHGRNHSTLRYY